jgi:hypothetical protein
MVRCVLSLLSTRGLNMRGALKAHRNSDLACARRPDWSVEVTLNRLLQLIGCTIKNSSAGSSKGAQ